jgi:hypothetical protein
MITGTSMRMTCSGLSGRCVADSITLKKRFLDRFV